MMRYYVDVRCDATFWYGDSDFTILHREDGPAIELTNGDQHWYINGKRHREDGPAIDSVDGYQAWYIKDTLHRDDGFAVGFASGTRSWYRNGVLHREDGPAIEFTSGEGKWYINGTQYSEQDFIRATAVKELTVAQIEALLGFPVKVVK